MRKRNQIRQAGFTFIEVLVTVLFICVCVIALVRFQNYISYTDSLNQQNGEAVMLATQEMEKLRDFQVINTTSGFVAYQDIVSGSSTATGVNTSYTITWTVTPFVNPTYKKIVITVTWTDRYNAAQSIELVKNVDSTAPPNSAAIK
jgi:Tfp pilus assembly protein PilV